MSSENAGRNRHGIVLMTMQYLRLSSGHKRLAIAVLDGTVTAEIATATEPFAQVVALP
jgi:hypothetical protein